MGSKGRLYRSVWVLVLHCDHLSDMEFLEVLTEGLNRVLLVRGGGREVITIYSWRALKVRPPNPENLPSPAVCVIPGKSSNASTHEDLAVSVPFSSPPKKYATAGFVNEECFRYFFSYSIVFIVWCYLWSNLSNHVSLCPGLFFCLY